MHTQIKKQIIECALNNPLEEICGFLYYDFESVKLFKCKNIAQEKDKNFEISHDDYLECIKLGKVFSIYHSHPLSDSAFSQNDIDIAEEMMLPIYVYGFEDKKFQEYIPASYYVDYQGVAFNWGFFDCYEIVRIYFRQKFNIFLKDYDRDESYHHDEYDIIAENFEKEGFNKTEKSFIMNNDILISSWNLNRPQHFAIFIGNSKILHHPMGRLSLVETLTNDHMKRVKYILRYKNKL